MPTPAAAGAALLPKPTGCGGIAPGDRLAAPGGGTDPADGGGGGGHVPRGAGGASTPSALASALSSKRWEFM